MKEVMRESMVSDRKVGEGVGGKPVRGCDNCVRRSAGWYCAADDAFLCETCDSSVHSANPLARRHERVRLKTELHPPSGFTKKARTPRRHKRIPMHLVPCSDEETDDNLLYRVPVFNNPIRFSSEERENHDVESLLGFDFDMDGLGIDFDDQGGCLRIKDENEEAAPAVDEGKNLLQIDLGRETFELNFDEEDNKMLKLDHERVMSAWDDKKSPWMTGEKPELSTSDCQTWSTQYCCCLGSSGGYGETMAVAKSREREARVSRYREKRRTRLFSKKIRYEVRKLNAEKRPRIKGRFVKRPSAFP